MNYLGIDLGTTNSVACTVKNGKYAYINFRNKELLPSAMLYKDGKISIGSIAKRKATIYPTNYISSSKTYMGSNEKKWQIEDRTFTPTDVATEILHVIHDEAVKFFGNNDEIETVITTPAYFSSSQNAATAEAGKRAGFKVKQILAEPVAAAIAYAFDDLKTNEKIYVVDLGGGTFDVTLLEVSSNNEYRTLMKDGDNHLGGDDFDIAIYELMLSHIRQDIGVDLSTEESSELTPEAYSRARQKLLQEAERVKCVLSDAEEDDISIMNLFPYRDGNYDFDMTLTRAAFMQAASKLVRHVENTIRDSLHNVERSVDEVNRVILVGGSANMPFIREYVEEFFHKKPYSDKDLSKLVAMGAALRADGTRGDTITLHDIIAHSLGIEIVGDRFSPILIRGREYPCEEMKIYTTSHDYQEVVSIDVYEGEDENQIKNNYYYGGFQVDGIEKALEGIPKIEVTFSFDESCILHVKAKDRKTGVSGAKDLAIHFGH